MTSLNVVRVNRNSGIFVCDEGRYWNNEWMIFYTPDKIRAILDPDLVRETGIIAYMGSTGASSFGDEIMEMVRERLCARFRESLKKNGGPPEDLQTIEQIATFATTEIQSLLRRHVDDFLKSRYHVTTTDIVREAKTINGIDVDLENEEILKEAARYAALKNSPPELMGLLNNAQLLAGYDPTTGFRIFQIEEREPVMEEVADIYLSDGSGKITCELTLSAFASAHRVTDRRNGLDRVEVLAVMLQSVEQAHQLVAGVGGYPKIIYVDGESENASHRVTEYSNWRCRLATEIVTAAIHEYIPWDNAYSFLDRLIFQEASFDEIERELFQLGDEEALSRFLRGYRVSEVLVDSTSDQGGAR